MDGFGQEWILMCFFPITWGVHQLGRKFSEGLGGPAVAIRFRAGRATPGMKDETSPRIPLRSSLLYSGYRCALFG